MTGEHAAGNRVVTKLPAQRLCNEIQLFDLCELEKCTLKVGRFCTDAALLTAFEQISDAELTREVLVSEELEEGEGACDEEYDDAFEEDGLGDEAEYDEDI